ncbi:restriction endonuclease subunit S [Nitrospina sp. 32_T5]|uniref:restriction endonuclease subunit S n=1 Tax=unclassified Nitrospina TaxID=2638683 RepID=UPI003F9BEF67
MPDAKNLITDFLDVWTSAIQVKSSAGRNNNQSFSLYGIQKLRELILELAVRGKLVPQDPQDEPASVLLEKVFAEKLELVKNDAIRKNKNFPEIKEEEKLFLIPNGWEWARINDIGRDWGQKIPDEEFTYIDVSAIDNTFGSIVSPDVLSPSEAPSRARKIVKQGTVIYSTVRPYLKNIALIEQEYSPQPIASTAFAVVHPLQGMSARFFVYYFRSPEFVKYVESVQTGIAYPAINDKQFFGGVIPIPPIAEQHRIVAKVDELMTLCHQLEKQTEDSITAHHTLVATLLGTLTQSQSPEEFSENWTRISEHFDSIFSTEHSIDQLKQTILQLAVMGKLVPQDPKDEPAPELLKRLFKDRNEWLYRNSENNPECLTMIKKLKKLKEAAPPFPLPSSWACAHLIQVSRMLVDCHNKTAPYVDKGIPIIRTSNIREKQFRLSDLKYISEETYNFWSRRCPPAPNDIIFTREAPMGEAAIIPGGSKWCLGQRTMLIRPMHEYISSKFLLLALTEPHLLERASEHAIGSTVKHLRVGDVERLNIPIPPLAEQHRIVSKVDKLMTLCNQLKSGFNDAQTTQAHLADSIIEQTIA